MVGVEELSEILTTVVLTGRVKGRKPVSIFLIAKPESGKTTILDESSTNGDNEKMVITVTDATGTGLQTLCQMHPRATHIAYNDLTVVTAHGKSTQKYLYAMLNAMTEEGIQSLWTPGGFQKIESGRKGLIAGTTPRLVSDGRMWWKSVGLDSRCLPIFYEYRKPLILKIQNQLVFGLAKDLKPVPIPKVEIPVKIDAKMGKRIIDAANVKAQEFDEQGIRKSEQFATLVMAHAIKRSWKNPSVTQKDLDWLYSAMKFMSWSKGVEIG